MFHRSELGAFAALLLCERNSQIPELGDDWRCMDWALESLDACDADVIGLFCFRKGVEIWRRRASVRKTIGGNREYLLAIQ